MANWQTKKLFAYSLVELVISIITISIIVGALAPVITKTLLSEGKSVSDGVQYYEPRNQKDCDLYGAKFIPKSISQTSNLCMFKYNAGNHPSLRFNETTTYQGITIVSGGTSCSGNLCCWYENTSNSATCTKRTTQSGCKRTVCKLAAGKNLCYGYSSDGSIWRLPTSQELTNLNSYISGNLLNFAGVGFTKSLDLCTKQGTDVSLFSNCPSVNNCAGKECRPSAIISLEGKYLELSSPITTTTGNYSDDVAYSIRCVSDKITNLSTEG